MIKILATVGEGFVGNVKAMQDAGVDIFRINLSWTSLQEVEKKIKLLQHCSYPNTSICIDTEGSQVRTGEMYEDSHFYEPNTFVQLTSKIAGYNQISLSQSVRTQLKMGDTINNCISYITHDFAKITKQCVIKPNRPITINRKLEIPAFTEKDVEATKIGQKLGIKHYALSFARSYEEVWKYKNLLFKDDILISKIESQQGLNNLEEIIEASDAILIDRGDLSREVDLKDVPMYQEIIVNKCKSKDKPVYVATNFLESMCEENKPTIAEVNDVAATIKMGVDGLVLAAETAIGKYPVETVKFVKELIERYG